jgi:hypothetical protein
MIQEATARLVHEDGAVIWLPTARQQLVIQAAKKNAL